MLFEVRVPEAVGSEPLKVAFWHVRELDQIEQGQVVVELEGEQQKVEVVIPCHSVIKEIRAGKDQKVSPGDLLAIIEA